MPTLYFTQFKLATKIKSLIHYAKGTLLLFKALTNCMQDVSGSISKVGTLFSINARLLNVQSAEVVKSISHDHMGDIVDLMTKGIKESASKLMELKEEEAPSIAILPFENKGAPEDAFYAYGIVADLIDFFL